MKSPDEVKAFYKNATVNTNPAADATVLNDALQAGKLKPQERAAHPEPRIRRFIMRNSITKLATAALVVLAAALGLSLLNRSTQPVYGMTEALELIAKAKTMHIKGCRFSWTDSTPEPLKLPFEQWHDFENGRYHFDTTHNRDGEIGNHLLICDGQYVMREGAYKPAGGTWHKTVEFRKVDPNAGREGSGLDYYRQLSRIEGFNKVGSEVIDGEAYDIWQGEFDVGGDGFTRRRLQAWLSPRTGNVGRTRGFWQEQGQWILTTERTLIERDVPLDESLFLTEPRPGHEITTPKEKATVSELRPPDIYEHTKFNYAPLMYWVRPVFALEGGSLLACWQGVDNLESHDQSKYFANLQVGNDLPKLPAEVYALSPEPNVRDVMFTGFHLAHTEKETELGRRWYEWSLYIPDGEPPEPKAVLNYRIHYRLNIDRTDSNGISVLQTAVAAPPKIETEADFETKVRKAMAERSDNGAIPDHVTYENVLQLAEQLRAAVAK